MTLLSLPSRIHFMRKNLIVTLLFMCLGVSALLLRTSGIARNPPSLSWDEVSIGYNAYSILKTGRDEHGRFLPFDTFVAYGDYKPPFAIYAAVPFVAIFGLTDLAVRLPSALFGSATVLLAYFLVFELFVQRGMEKRRCQWLALTAMGVLTFSPWHINLSRGGFEANIALFFVVLGTWLAVSATSHPRRRLWMWLPFVAAIYTFNSARVFSVLFVPALVIYTWADIKKHMRTALIGVVIGALAMAPIVPHLLSPQARLRFNEVNIFTDLSVVEKSNARIAREPESVIGKLVNNRRVGYAFSFLIHFMDNLQPQFLFVTGDGNPKFSIQDVGQLYLVEAPLLAIGMVVLFIEYPAIGALLLYWIIAAILPAATARETPHALRILNSLPTWHIFIAFGLMSILQYVSKLSTKKIYVRAGILVIVILYAFSIIYYLHTYYRHYPIEYSGEWQYGYREAIQAITPIAPKYDHIMITDSIGRPYMYMLFYTRTDPNDLFRTAHAYFDAAGFYHVDGFLTYQFGGKLPVSIDSRTLYVWDSGTVPKGARVIDTIKLLNGNPVLTIFDSGSVKL